MKALERSWEEYRREVDEEIYRHKVSMANAHKTYRDSVSADEEVLDGEKTPEEEEVMNKVIEGRWVERRLANGSRGMMKIQRRMLMERKRNGDLALTGMVDDTKWNEVEGCYAQVSRSDLKWMKGTIFGICPEGLLSPVAARIVGYATSWQPALSSSMVVEIMKELSEEVVVDIYISLGAETRSSTWTSSRPARRSTANEHRTTM